MHEQNILQVSNDNSRTFRKSRVHIWTNPFVLFRWPVIIVIIIGALVICSVLFCCFRCLCCGLECCCGCFKCCNACCPTPRNKRNKNYQEAPQSQPFVPSQGPAPYAPAAPQPAPQDPMSYSGYRGQPQPRPQFARFDTVSSKGSANKNHMGSSGMHEDSLPEMPSLSAARDRHVEDPSTTTHDGVHEDGIPLREQKQLPHMASHSNLSAIDGSSTSSLGKHPTEGETGPLANNQGFAGIVPQRQYASTTGLPRQFEGQASASNTGVSPYQQPPHSGGAANAYYRGLAGSDSRQSPVSPIEHEQNSNSAAGTNVYSGFPPPSYRTHGAPPSMPQRENTSSPSSYARYYGSHTAQSPSPSHGGLASPPPVQRYRSPQPQQQQQLGGYSAYNAQAIPNNQNQYSAYAPSHNFPQQSSSHQQTQDLDPGLFYPPVSGTGPSTGHYQ